MKAHVVVIFFPKIFHWSGHNYTLEWIKVGNDMMSDTTDGPSNWELAFAMESVPDTIIITEEVMQLAHERTLKSK